MVIKVIVWILHQNLGGNLKVYEKLAIIGSGSWSVALASVFRNINLIVKTNDTKRTKKNSNFIKKYLEITDDYKDIVDCNLIFFANPSQNLRKDLKKNYRKILTQNL